MKEKLSTELSTYPQDIPSERVFITCGRMLTIIVNAGRFEM